MNDAAYTVFINLINLAVRTMPIFVCLDPKHSYGESIAAISVYLWVIMTSMESIFHISPQVFSAFRGTFPCLYSLVLLVFFKRILLKRGLLYISAWLSAVLSAPLNELAAWILKGHVSLTYGQICVVISLLQACGFYGFVRSWLRDKVSRLFDQLSRRSCSLLLTHPSASLFILFIGNNTIFSSRSLVERGLEDVLSYLASCIMILMFYVLILSSTLEATCCHRVEEEPQLARQFISQQREHCSQTLDYIEQMRIIRYDFRHHTHVLLNMDRGEWTDHLTNLRRELDMTVEVVFCQNQVVNRLLRGYAARARQDGVEFTARIDLSVHVPADDLTLYIVTGNLLENALEAYRRLTGLRFILAQARWLDDHLMTPMENPYNGQTRKNGSRILPSKRDDGLDILSIKCILNQPGNELDVGYNNATFTAIVKIVDRVLGQDVLFGSFPAQGKIKTLQSS